VRLFGFDLQCIDACPICGAVWCVGIGQTANVIFIDASGAQLG